MLLSQYGGAGHGCVLKREWSRQLTDYAGAGVAATVVHYLVMAILLGAISIPAVLASTVGAIAGAGVAYWMNARWTFDYRGAVGRSLYRFLCVAAVGVVLNAVLLAVGHGLLTMPLVAAQPAATLSVFIITFVVNRQWSFR